LNLSDNQLSGTLSNQFQKMSKLESIDLDDNKFEGNLDDILNCGTCNNTLISFSSADNPLSGSLPERLFGFSALKKFSVSKSKLTGTIPSGIGKLAALEKLDLAYNDNFSNGNGNGNGNDNDNEKHQDDNTETSTTTNESSSSNDNDNDNNKNKNDNSDDVVIALLERHRASATTTTTTTSSDSLSSLAVNNNNDSSGSSTSAARWKRRKQIAMGLVASIAITVGAAKIGILPGPPLEAATNSIAGSSSSITYGTYTNAMIARDAAMTGLTSILAVAMNRAISFGYESGAYDSKTGRKLTHILSAPLFIATWPFFSNASGARFFAGLVCLTNLIRLYLAGKGDAAESSLADTISRTGDRSEVLGGPFIYVCLFQLFILAFWRDSFPGVVAMTTMAAGDGMADIIGRRFGKNGYKWPFSDGQKSLVGTAAFCASAFALTTAACYWLLLTGCLALPSTLAFADVALRIGAISCICALVEILPIGDDNYTVPGSAALLAALWLR